MSDLLKLDSAIATFNRTKVHREERVASIKDLLATRCTPGNWNYNPYMHGFANGMILALAVLEDTPIDYLSTPAMFLEDYKKLDQFN
jgi:hypothetical protein